MAKIVILGANGQLAHDLLQVLQGEEIIPLTHDDLDVCDFTTVRRTLENAAPAILVNTAAIQADKCERFPDLAFMVNTLAPKNLATICRDIDALLVHYSSDYVFGGDKGAPHHEADLPSPVNVYGVAKVAGEHFIRSVWPKHCIVRTSGLFGVGGISRPTGNFVETMLRLGRERGEVRVVTDQVFSPSYAPDVARRTWELLQSGATGTFHVTNSGACSWYELACAIFEIAGMPVKVRPVTTAEFGAPTRRPSYSVLDNAGPRALGMFPLRPWREALADYIAARARVVARV